LEEVKIAAVNQRDLYGRPFEGTGGVQSAEPPTDNHYTRHQPLF
jgi:hypothetical protein